MFTSSSSPDEFRHLLQQLGPSMPEIRYLIQHQPDQWELGMDHGVMVLLQWQHEPSGLRLSLPLGTAPDSARQEIYARMLGAHLQRRETRPARVALSTEGELLVLGEFAPPPDSLQQLQQQLAHFIADASALAADAAQADGPPPMANSHQADTRLISQRA